MGGFEPHQAIMDKLGKHSCGQGCLYIKKLKDVDQTALRELVVASVAHIQKLSAR